MIIIVNYVLEYKKQTDLYHVISKEECRCPYCADCLKAVGSRRRILYRQDGTVIHLVIRRLRCCGCGRIHHELPDMAIPYKRYEAAAVEAALDCRPSENNDYPCETSTAMRLRYWYMRLEAGARRSTPGAFDSYYSLNDTKLIFMKNRCCEGRLQTIVRVLVNSGRWKQTCYA